MKPRVLSLHANPRDTRSHLQISYVNSYRTREALLARWEKGDAVGFLQYHVCNGFVQDRHLKDESILFDARQACESVFRVSRLSTAHLSDLSKGYRDHSARTSTIKGDYYKCEACLDTIRQRSDSLHTVFR